MSAAGSEAHSDAPIVSSSGGCEISAGDAEDVFEKVAEGDAVSFRAKTPGTRARASS